MIELLKPWVKELTLQQQAVLVLALRGCDSAPKEDISKKLLRYYRFMVINNARPLAPDNIFMVEESPPRKLVQKFIDSTDHYPVHWIMHFTHACEIIGFLHPDREIRIFWISLYRCLVKAFHMHEETLEEMTTRLRH